MASYSQIPALLPTSFRGSRKPPSISLMPVPFERVHHVGIELAGSHLTVLRILVDVAGETDFLDLNLWVSGSNFSTRLRRATSEPFSTHHQDITLIVTGSLLTTAGAAPGPPGHIQRAMTLQSRRPRRQPIPVRNRACSVGAHPACLRSFMSLPPSGNQSGAKTCPSCRGSARSPAERLLI